MTNLDYLLKESRWCNELMIGFLIRRSRLSVDHSHSTPLFGLNEPKITNYSLLQGGNFATCTVLCTLERLNFSTLALEVSLETKLSEVGHLTHNSSKYLE